MNTKLLRVECSDRPGLVHGITGVLLRHGCNVTTNHEFVDAENSRFFMRTEFTGEIIAPDSPGRDPIVTRILWLRGREARNAHAYGRMIYIHGTPEERFIGIPASYGCIRMRSRDIINLYDIVGVGAAVTVVDEPLVEAVPGLAAAHIIGISPPLVNRQRAPCDYRTDRTVWAKAVFRDVLSAFHAKAISCPRQP